MIAPYEVFRLSTDSPQGIEQLGSKEKFWFEWQKDSQPWLFKFARQNTGEDWSEKIASEIACLLEVPAAQIELAEFQSRRGSASRSFVHLTKGEGLIHGSEILAGWDLSYDNTRMRGQNQHCVPNIIAAVQQSFPDDQRNKQLTILAGYIFLDALICNTDRHHDNWGLLRWRSSKEKPFYAVAPSFDHASSLGRELSDERRKSIIDTGEIGRYVNRGRGGIFWSEVSPKAENPIELARKASKQYPSYFRPWFQRLRQLDRPAFHDIIERVPEDRMGVEAKSFCKEFLLVTRRMLEEVEI